MYPDLPKPAIFAHRGSSAHAPENTLAAFELAIKQGADAIELDVDLSLDLHLVIMHDSTVDRTTNGSGAVRSHSFAALRELDAGSHFDIAFKGERIPELSEVFEAIGQRIVINIELKYSFDLSIRDLKGTSNSSTPINVLTGKVAQLILRHGLIGRVIISSFHPLILRRMRKILPEAACAFLTDRGKRGSIFRSRFGERIAPHQALHPDFHDVTPSLIHRVHETGRRLNAYTVNGTQDMKDLFSMGIDGIFTDDPLLAKKVLEAGSPILSST